MHKVMEIALESGFLQTVAMRSRSCTESLILASGIAVAVAAASLLVSLAAASPKKVAFRSSAGWMLMRFSVMISAGRKRCTQTGFCDLVVLAES